MKFCDAVKYVRTKKLYLTQEEFAKELGIGYATLNRLENNSLHTSAKVKRKFLPYFEKYGIVVED